jgi:type VI secretion system protein ImpI
MTLTLTIENETSLPDGGPLSVTVQGKRGIDIGRDAHLDWTLPDPSRFISGKHCEVRYKDGGYWLHDVSTNGTFLNGADNRMQAPHRLRDGDRFLVGNYIVAAKVDGDGAASRDTAAPAAAPAVDYVELWTNDGEVAPPINAKELRPPQARAPAMPDFLDWAVDVPDPPRAPPQATPRADPALDRDMDWAAGRPSSLPATPPAPAPIPAPRRPAPAETAKSPWDEGVPERDASASSPAPSAPVAETSPPARPTPAPALGETGSADAFLRQLARSAGLADDLFTRGDTAELARQLGGVLRVVSENLRQLLSARAQSKQLARSASHTMVQAIGNNPLKFAPSTEDAMRIMFGPPTQSYLDATRAIEQSFADLKQHQIKTYSAMQHALGALMADLGPRAIDESTPDDRGFAGVLASRKARLWEAYVARWQAKVREDERGPVEAFMLHFAEYYDRDPAAPMHVRRPADASQLHGTQTGKDDVLAQ